MTTEGLPLSRTSAGGPGAGATSPSRTQQRDHTRHAGDNTTAMTALRRFGTDALLVTLAVLDVWLVIPNRAPTYTIVLSLVACAALAARRWFPFTVVLVTLPGFLAGWSELAAMLALGLLATRKQWHWQVWTAAGLAWLCRFVEWPLSHFVTQSWREQVLAGLYGFIVAGMPVAIGLLIGARAELANRLAELAASRDRERTLHTQAVRAEERAKLARDMHDTVSHDITLIAMQAGALSVSANSDDTRESARTIRTLSTHTLEELRSLLGMLRSDCEGDNDERTPDIRELENLVHGIDVPVKLTITGVDDPVAPKISVAVYRTVQECLTNVGKHAAGATATVSVTGAEGELRVRVSNGPPCAEASSAALPSGGHGLDGLAERARLLGGTFDSSATTGGGFVVTASYPLHAA